MVLALLHRAAGDRDTALADTMLESVLRTVLTTSAAPPASELAPLVIAFGTAVPGLPALTDAERGVLTEWVGRTLAALPADTDADTGANADADADRRS